MDKEKVAQVISECCNDVYFEYNGKLSGIASEVKNGIPTFQAWHGEEIKYYGSVDVLMKDKFFSGKSLAELTGSIFICFA